MVLHTFKIKSYFHNAHLNANWTCSLLFKYIVVNRLQIPFLCVCYFLFKQESMTIFVTCLLSLYIFPCRKNFWKVNYFHIRNVKICIVVYKVDVSFALDCLSLKFEKICYVLSKEHATSILLKNYTDNVYHYSKFII